jgi:hypothetical protein
VTDRIARIARTESVEYISHVHRIEPPIDFERGERSVLLCAGSGMMLAIMDACPSLRWCMDVDLLDKSALERLPGWATCLGNVTELMVLAGWYCSTNPVPLASAARGLRKNDLLCYVQCRGVGGDPFETLRTAQTLGELITQINARFEDKKRGRICQ